MDELIERINRAYLMHQTLCRIASLLLLCLNHFWCSGQQIADPYLQQKAQSIRSSDFFLKKYLPIQQFADSFLRHQNALQDSLNKQKPLLIKGIVRDVNTGEGIPFVHLKWTRSGKGTVSELDGTFMLPQGNAAYDSLIISAPGYKRSFRILDSMPPILEFELSRSENLLREVVVRPGEDPAIALIKKIIANKQYNNPDKYSNYKYELYNKLELDLVRMSKEQFVKIPFMKPFAFIFENVDSFSEQKPFLPVFLTETLSDYYFQRNPKKTKEFVKASLVKGIENESVTQFLGGMYQQINLYANFIDVFDKQFISPISNNAPNYYKYKIIDTQEAYGKRIILVQFAPKRAGENCFVGDLWVVDSMYALQRISLDIPADANINLVNRVSLYQEFAPVGDTLWFNTKDKFIADFTVPYGGKRMPGFIGRKTTSYKNILLNDSTVSAVVNDKNIKQDIIVADNARNLSTDFWNNARHDSLNKNERAIYAMIDTLNTMPIFNRTKNAISFLANGTQNVGKLEFGPYWALYNRNPVEGHRFRFSMGTNPKLFKDAYLNGYLAYGTKDQRLKYKIAGLFLLERHPRHRLYTSYTSDIDRSISYYSEAATDNFLSNFVRKQGVPFKFLFVKDARIEHYKEYFNGFSHEVNFIHKISTPYLPLPSSAIFRDRQGLPSDNLTNAELGIKLRFAYKERFLEGDYYRISVGTKYPVVAMRWAMGLKNFLNAAYNYQKISLNVSDYLKIPHLGSIRYNVFAGKIWGTLPYPLLEVHPGNDFYYYNQFAFSMMNRFEFISDTYAGLMFEHNIGGGIFNYVPLLKKAKMRQFWTLKSAIGSLSDANKALNLNQGFEFKTLQSTPYLELGTGIENIFQLFRVDFVWRIAPTPSINEPLSNRFGIFGSFKVGF